MPRRHRITVTIRDDLLASLDRLVDRHQIRNRSHALEFALQRTLNHSTNQAIILASGAGVAMRPFTYEIPKPLIPVHGKPILEHTIERLRQNDIRDLIITVSHLKDRITQHFGDGSAFGVRITYVHEGKPRGTGSSLRAASEFVTSSPVLVLYGDILLDLDIRDFLKTHQDTKPALATIALTSVADPSGYGAVKLRGTRVAEFSEKTPTTLSSSHLIFAGVMACNKELFSWLPKKTALSLERDLFPKLVQEQRLFGYPFEGQWFDVSTPETYEHILKSWQKK